ncbi:hypothetical protein KIH87_04515 [Paraneptunicella aestuarii]|uniref:hypothetical protein n=1 Tax=Paraneptunicella aestuarii TaxID=2831148 RepID=UPI001E3231C6|nr:hypothetical protein [Paraneptunicella aestuarii]UAA39627.1 hypothetical protein KIH87_04515 [Paraneptunicella aestuarii]
MNLKKYVLAIVLAMTSLVVGATEMQVSSEANASASCWWIFCVSSASGTVTVSAGGAGDPPGPIPN